MSQNNPTRNKYNSYSNNQPRGHSDFGQAGYSQQYGFQAALQSVSANPAHDMNKQVSAGQPGMYPSSGGMPSGPQHHHQASMTGPAPSPQPSSIVNPSQQLNRTHVPTIPNYYARNNPPRTVQSIGRNNMAVNQAQQPAASQYSTHMQIIPSHHPMHTVTPVFVQTQGIPMYQQQRFPTHPYGSINAPQMPIYPPYNWSNFNNTPHGGANGYYPSHQLSTYPMNSQQVNSAPTPAPSNQVPKKRLAIINPETGKDILQESVTEEVPPVKEETSHNDLVGIQVGLQFATQVAQALVETEKKSESLDTTSIENSRLVQSTVLCPTADVETVNTPEQVDNTNVSDVNESFIDDQESIPYYSKEPDINNMIDSYENKSSVEECLTIETKNLILDNEIASVPSPREVENIVPDSNQTEKSYYDIQEPTEVSVIESVSPDRTVEEQSTNVIVEENLPVVDSDIVNSNTKNEVKKKTKRRKDFNKRGESKEGGEMDAFLDKNEESPPLQVTPQVPLIASSNDSSPPISEIRAPSPIPIVDDVILSTIPLPGEEMNVPKTEDSDKELSPEDPTVISNNENDIEDKENVSEDSTQNKIILKYTYKEDQWSPLNPEGKKQYDRDFLLQLQSQPMSLCKPSNLPNLDVIKDKAHIQRLTEISRTAPIPMQPVRPFDPFMPTYARGGNALRPPHPAINRRSQTGGRGEKKPKIISLPTNQNIKLHESENAWKPSHKSENNAIEDAEEQDLFRRIRGILNKLTPQKFQTLVEQVKELPINTISKLEGTINLIFEKAIDEPNFSVPYANMCKQLALMKVPLEDGQGFVNFRKLLLTKCQKEFEHDKSIEKKREEKIKAIKAAQDDEEKRKELQMEFDEEEKKVRMRQLGNIRFIGELFKLNMLIEPIMHECIKKLLAQGDEESLECLCRLLKTIGKELDEKGSKTRESSMDVYFVNMQKIVDKRLTSSRVRFMLQDVVDLKKNNWVPRRDENNPKTIDQIHKEAEKEAREAQQALQNISYSKRPPDDRRKLSGRNMGVSEDGWTPTSKSNKGSYSMVDPSKLKLTKPDEVDSIRLGPGGKGPQSWCKGSIGGNRTSESDVKTALTNRYSALADQASSFENRRGSQRSAASSRESSRGRSSQLPPSVRKTPSTSRERESLIETVKELNRNIVPEPKPQDIKKIDNQINGKIAESVAVLGLNGPDLSEDDIEKKTKPLIDEFLHNADFEEAEKCVMELASPTTVQYFIYFAINQVLERSSQTRYLLGQLLYSLVKKEIVSLEQYKKGLSGVLENIDDYAVDIPLIWEYMGDILEPMTEDNKFQLTFLKDVLEPCIPSETAGKLVSAVLHCAAKKKGTIKLGEIWKNSGLQWSDFLGSSVSINEFISKNKLEFTVSQTKVIPNTETSIEEVRTKLKELLETTEENESIFDYVDAKVPPSAVSEPAFIRALAQEVHKAAINGTGSKCELDLTTLKKRIPLLTRYIDHNENLELQALYAVQHLINDMNQPKGVLRQIFDILYDDDVITEETFKLWENSKDPAEQEGKGVALMSVRGFFTWLREAESGEDLEDE